MAGSALPFAPRRAALRAALALSLLLPATAARGQLGLTLEPVVGDFDRVSAISHAPGDTSRLFVAERNGLVRIVLLPAGQTLATPFLDLSGIVGGGGIEQGLLALAFDPEYGTNGYFYVAYTDDARAAVVTRYRVSALNPHQADPASAVEILSLPQPSATHNIHELVFGPMGLLFVGSGDGGPGGDPAGNGQALDVLLGKVLRLDVDPDLHPGGGYSIPPDNPFVGVAGARDEIWAYGLRNPANFSFDRATGDLYLADVGQVSWEEVNFEPAGAPGGLNFGWSVMEGAHCFDPPVGCDPSGLTLPVAEYPQDEEDCAVIGGYVYRGARTSWLRGRYLLADFCSGRLRALRWGCTGWTLSLLHDAPFNISALGEDAAGEIYAAEWSTTGAATLFRLVGESAPTIFTDGFESGDLSAWTSCVQ